MAIKTAQAAREEARKTISMVDVALLHLKTQRDVVMRRADVFRGQRHEVGQLLTRFWLTLYRNEPETVQRALDMDMKTVARVLSRRNGVQRRIDDKCAEVEGAARQLALIEPKFEQAKSDLERLKRSQAALETSPPFMRLYRLWLNNKYSPTLERPHDVLWWLMCLTVIPCLIWNCFARLRESRVKNALLEARDSIDGFDGELPSAFEVYDRMPRKASHLLAVVRVHGSNSKARMRLLGELQTLEREKAGIGRELEVAAGTDIERYFKEQAPRVLTASMVAAWPEDARAEGYSFVILTKQIQQLEAAAVPLEQKIADLGKYRDTVARAKRKWEHLPKHRVLDEDVTRSLVTRREALLHTAERERGRCNAVYADHIRTTHTGLDEVIGRLMDTTFDAVDALGGPEAIINQMVTGAEMADSAAHQAVDIVEWAANDVAEAGERALDVARDAAEDIVDAVEGLVDDFASLDEVGVEAGDSPAIGDDGYGEQGADHTDDAGGSTDGWGSSGGDDGNDRDEMESPASNDRASDPPPDTSGGGYDGDTGGWGSDSSSGGDD